MVVYSRKTKKVMDRIEIIYMHGFDYCNLNFYHTYLSKDSENANDEQSIKDNQGKNRNY